MLNENVIEIGIKRDSDRYRQTGFSCDLPNVPVMPETVLLLELGIYDHSADLQEITNIVLGDPGAAIQIMRLAGHEYSIGEEPLSRVEDFISALGLQECIEVVSRRTVKQCMNKSAIQEAWSHSKKIAERCKQIAEGLVAQNVNPNEAYLTGLLHELGSLPMILDWEPSLGFSENPDLAGLELAKAWLLPKCIVDYFSELRHLRGTNRWTGIVQRAHNMLC